MSMADLMDSPILVGSESSKVVGYEMKSVSENQVAALFKQLMSEDPAKLSASSIGSFECALKNPRVKIHYDWKPRKDLTQMPEADEIHIVCSDDCKFQQNLGYYDDTGNRQVSMQECLDHKCEEWCRYYDEWTNFMNITPCPECGTRLIQHHVEGCSMKTMDIGGERRIAKKHFHDSSDTKDNDEVNDMISSDDENPSIVD